MRDFGDWKSVFVAIPILPHAITRGILSWAGLTPTLDTDDALYTNGDFIGIYAKDAGTKTITLPGEFVIDDMFSDRSLQSAGGKVTLDIACAETFIGRIRRTHG